MLIMFNPVNEQGVKPKGFCAKTESRLSFKSWWEVAAEQNMAPVSS